MTETQNDVVNPNNGPKVNHIKCEDTLKGMHLDFLNLLKGGIWEMQLDSTF